MDGNTTVDADYLAVVAAGVETVLEVLINFRGDELKELRDKFRILGVHNTTSVDAERTAAVEKEIAKLEQALAKLRK